MVVWHFAPLQGGQERCHLLPYKEGKLWVLLLVSASVHMTQQTLAALQAAMGSPSQQLAAQVKSHTLHRLWSHLQ